MSSLSNLKLLEEFLVDEKLHLQKYSYTLSKNTEDALDIVSSSILKAFKSVHNFKGDSSVKTWFYRILINTAYDYNKEKNGYVYIDDIQLEINYDPHFDYYENIDLIKALNNLPEDLRNIVIMKYFNQLTTKEISNKTSISENTIKTRLYKALKLLKEDKNLSDGGFNDK
jgi:RNA polymerase sigma-70 factor (ECF subfamily)